MNKFTRDIIGASALSLTAACASNQPQTPAAPAVVEIAATPAAKEKKPDPNDFPAQTLSELKDRAMLCRSMAMAHNAFMTVLIEEKGSQREIPFLVSCEINRELDSSLQKIIKRCGQIHMPMEELTPANQNNADFLLEQLQIRTLTIAGIQTTLESFTMKRRIHQIAAHCFDKNSPEPTFQPPTFY